MRFDLMEEGVAYPKDHIFLYGFNVEKNGFYCIIRFKYIKRIKPITNLLNCKIGNGLACPTFFLMVRKPLWSTKFIWFRSFTWSAVCD